MSNSWPILSNQAFAIALMLSAAACALWPPRNSLVRFNFRQVHHPGMPTQDGGRQRPIVSINPPAFGLILGCGVGVVGSIPLGITTAIAVSTVSTLLRSGARRTEIDRTRIETVDAVKVLARELRTGAAVTTACEAAADVAGHRAAPMISALAVAARLGSHSMNIPPDGPTDGLAQSLDAAWKLSNRHGIPLAALVESAAENLGRAVNADARQNALLAGPKFSGYLLSALPLLGMALGAGMGANPLPVLFGPGVGGILLMVGVLLTCLGLLWSARIAS